MRRLLALTALAAPLALAATAQGAIAAQSGAQLAGILKDNPVFADPRARPTLTAAQAERVRLRIAERAPGRLAIAIVSGDVARAAGGIRELARAIDRHFDVNGALLVIDSDHDSAWVVVSYSNPARATSAVQAAFSGKGTFSAHTLEAVDRLAVADPGPGPASGGPTRTAPQVGTDVTNAVRTIFIVVGALIALPFLILALVLVSRGRRRRTDRPAGGLEVAPPPPAPADIDAQRQAAEKAFGSTD